MLSCSVLQITSIPVKGSKSGHSPGSLDARTVWTNSSEVKPDLGVDQDQQC